MIKRTIRCPTCGKNIAIKEKKGLSVDFLDVEVVKKIWAEKTDSEKVEELEKLLGFRKEFAIHMVETRNKVEKLSKKIKDILEDHETTPYEKKLALFNMIKKLDVGGMSLEKKKRTNWLLQGHLYSELAKNC